MSITEQTLGLFTKRTSKDERAQPRDGQNNNATPRCWCASLHMCGYCPCRRFCA